MAKYKVIMLVVDTVDVDMMTFHMIISPTDHVKMTQLMPGKASASTASPTASASLSVKSWS